ncbi:hypothetical protein SAMN05216553_11525 [Lentzea fradiae]|uniref:Uncharacterized protein n=1 Tax=Lentzea fradiae TaxID=200378 RepID=A0A1G7Z7A7_9PSEU|nr:hypothetical protein SAMN05216553_11525 [Lentzea fradiae]
MRPPRSGPCCRLHRPIFLAVRPLVGISRKTKKPMCASMSTITSGQPHMHKPFTDAPLGEPWIHRVPNGLEYLAQRRYNESVHLGRLRNPSRRFGTYPGRWKWNSGSPTYQPDTNGKAWERRRKLDEENPPAAHSRCRDDRNANLAANDLRVDLARKPSRHGQTGDVVAGRQEDTFCADHNWPTEQVSAKENRRVQPIAPMARRLSPRPHRRDCHCKSLFVLGDGRAGGRVTQPCRQLGKFRRYQLRRSDGRR